MNTSFKIIVPFVVIAPIYALDYNDLKSREVIDANSSKTTFNSRSLISKIPSTLLNSKNIAGKTPLICAIEAKDIPLIEKLIASGENVNAVNGCDQPHMGYPVLRYAIDSGSEKIVMLLLKHGADSNRHTSSPIIHAHRTSANVRNLPLLSYAIQCHASQNIIELLISHGADINQKTIWNEWTPLMVAAYYGNQAAVKTLLTSGANVTDKNSVDGYRTAYDYASEMGHKEIMDDLYHKNS